LILSGPLRTSAHAYAVIASYGGHLVWGAIFVAAGLFTGLCAWKIRRWLRWALLLQAAPYGAIALSFAFAAVRYPDANLTAAPIYAWIMILHAFLSDHSRKEY
jgi:hypothetical protein